MTQRTIYDDALRYTVSVLRHAKDWQEAQGALADHPRFGPWISESGADEISLCQQLIREAEEILGDALPY